MLVLVKNDAKNDFGAFIVGFNAEKIGAGERLAFIPLRPSNCHY